MGTDVTFAVAVTDAVRVLVTYDAGTGSLQSIDLAQNAPSVWTGSIAGPVSGFFVQAIDSAGNVAMGGKEAFHIVGARRPHAANPIHTTHTFTASMELDVGDCNGSSPSACPSQVTGDLSVSLAGVGTIISDQCSGPAQPGTECQIIITSTEPGDSIVTLDWDVGFKTASYSFVEAWWEGSITIPKRVSPGSSGGTVCFALLRTDGALYTTSSNPQCLPFGQGKTDQVYRWEGLTAGTYTLGEVPLSGYALVLPITDIVVDGAHRDVILPTLENVPLICGNILDDFDRPDGPIGPDWSGATPDYRIVSQEVEALAGVVYWHPNVFGPDQEACVTISRLGREWYHSVLLKVQGAVPHWSGGAISVFYNINAEQVGVKTYIPNQGVTSWPCLTSR